MSDPILRCEDIHKSYLLGQTVLPVLRGISLSVQAGRFVAVVGSSGSGKSTLLHVLSGLDVPQRGQVFFRQEPMFEPEGLRKIPLGREANFAVLAEQERASNVTGVSRSRSSAGGAVVAAPFMEQRRDRWLNEAFGFVFQFYHLLPECDVLENVLLPAMVGRPVGPWLADRSGLERRACALLERVGLKDRLRHRSNELSGGERQRVAICRALMNAPAVLFADEPTGNLDGKTGREIFALLKELNQSGQTLVMVTHDRDLAREADLIVQLADGKVQ